MPQHKHSRKRGERVMSGLLDRWVSEGGREQMHKAFVRYREMNSLGLVGQ